VVKTGPQGPDKMDIAGALRRRRWKLIRAETVAVDVPARAEIIIEGRVLPGVREPEGPFGENTGYYFSNISPVVEVTAVTHRRTSSIRPCAPGPPTSTACSRWRPAPNCWASCAPRWRNSIST
jgi:UbiD family decarboxylase